MQTNEQILSRMAEDLRLRGLAPGTQEDYLMHTRLFLNWAGRPAETMDEEDIRDYLNHLITEKKLCVSTVNTYNAALRFFFGVTLNRNLNYRQIPRMRQTRRLPEILTRREVARVFDRDNSQWKVMTISAFEFIRRFLMHVLPPGFMKIRHYGLFGNRNKTKKLTICKHLTNTPVIAKVKASALDLLSKMFGRDFTLCQCCGQIRHPQGLSPPVLA